MHRTAHHLPHCGADAAPLSDRLHAHRGTRAGPPVARRGTRATAKNPSGTAPRRPRGPASDRPLGRGPARETRTGNPTPSRHLFGTYRTRPRGLPQPRPLATPTGSPAGRSPRVFRTTASDRRRRRGIRADVAPDADLSPAGLGQPLVLPRLLGCQVPDDYVEFYCPSTLVQNYAL